jgi:ABC-type transport system substrate-binding protein
MRKRILLIASIAAALLFGAGVTWAAIPSSDGVIHGCYRTSNPAVGSLIVIDAEAGQACPSGTAPLNWNQTGPQGPAGADGFTGYEVLTQHVDLQPFAGIQGTTMSAPTGKVILSGGFYFDTGSGNPVPQLAYSFVSLTGTTHNWGFVCQNAVPCPIDKYIVVANAP